MVQEGIIDMTGPGAEYTPFSKTCNLVVIAEPADGLIQHAHEEAVRIVDKIFEVYKGEAEAGEKLGNFIDRIGIKAFKEKTLV